MNLLQKQTHALTDAHIHEIVRQTEGMTAWSFHFSFTESIIIQIGYSGSDMDGLIREAALGATLFTNLIL
jgi:SpoVK/Ycf46/Vps4 family AAA+-type ATPase